MGDSHVLKKSISSLRNSPMSIFEEAQKEDNVVYIFNRNRPVGVILTPDKYESIHAEISELYDRVDELNVINRLSDYNRGQIAVDKVIKTDISKIEFDENDGWC